MTSDWLPRFGIAHDIFDAADLSQLEGLIKPNTKLIYVESPANPTMVLVDIAAVVEIAHKHGVKVFIDNTFATPYNTTPLDLGVDAVIHSLTKYIGGHGDLLGGAVISNDEQFLRECRLGTDIDTEQLHMEKGEYTEEKTVIMEKQKTVHTRISANENALQGISAKATEVESLDKKYTWVKALSDTANGCVSGKDRVMLETYIQATYFERMLARANIRLQKMSGGQYDLKRREQADDQRSQSGLELDIVDHINTTERSVNTLSGGEAFLASLALALGLSDEVQMSTGIQLDTLFVDEGFGSLDPEALSKAYNTLAGLTEGNRLVGIISHVPEQKERIDKQILVKKEKTGDSKAEICI